ncbi:MAG: hypothetical protein RMI63_07850 [Caldimicrobium sp.]|nr:hypothetical protein [Caldimicrobium sp.]MCX7613381.1 hypothetical protein [Caldimicrobium sp.]MDW8094913.1 hypothetical protein [Caldimicrobium sp.]MDW8182732.1 hypothetical protein [Caldimicrobium sp.]
MKCSRLKNLVRDWYQQVRSFTLSPLKMMDLVNKHIKQCPTCQQDEDLPLELEQLREIVRVPHTVATKEEKIAEEPVYVYEEEIVEEEEEI